jgi:hypothetical protein
MDRNLSNILYRVDSLCTTEDQMKAFSSLTDQFILDEANFKTHDNEVLGFNDESKHNGKLFDDMLMKISDGAVLAQNDIPEFAERALHITDLRLCYIGSDADQEMSVTTNGYVGVYGFEGIWRGDEVTVIASFRLNPGEKVPDFTKAKFRVHAMGTSKELSADKMAAITYTEKEIPLFVFQGRGFNQSVKRSLITGKFCSFELSSYVVNELKDKNAPKKGVKGVLSRADELSKSVKEPTKLGVSAWKALRTMGSLLSFI